MRRKGAALAVFHDHGNHPLDRFLKPGFRHVFCALYDPNGYWITVDGRDGLPAVEVVGGPEEDMRAFYERQGYTVVPVERSGPLRFPVTLTNCVGMVKAVLGITGVQLTPYQLYRRIKCT